MMNDRISAWLDNLGLSIYRESFQHNAITWDVLPELNEGDLEAMGVLLGHRKKLLRAIAQLPQSAEVMGPGSIPVGVIPEEQPFPPERDQAERRQLTVMFCDLVDSTALSSRLDPEDLQDVVRRFLDACSQAIGRLNGYIAKYMGDGMLVYFGYPQAHEHDAERAVHAGLAILDTVRAFNLDNPHPQFGIAARIGIATGQVVVGELMGLDTAKERSVFGETPNLAARLQALAKPDQLIIDLATKRLVGNEFEFLDLGASLLKGFDTPIQAWQILSIRPPASRFESYRSSQLAKFVGREQELSLLLGRWREAVGGEGQVVLLSGEAGIGKSRIARSLRDRLANERYQSIQFQCSPYHSNTALYPATTFLRQAAGLASQDSAQAQREKLDAMARESGIENQDTVSLLADLLSIQGDHRAPPLTVSSETRKEMTLEALVQYLERLANRNPVLFILEDAHWLDPTTRDLLTRIIGRIRQMRVLLLITFRPDFKPVWAEYSHVTSLTLSRLPRRQSAELVVAMTGGKVLPPEVQQAILAKADGIPLYIETLTENVLESGLLTEGNDSFTLKGPLKGLPIPDSLQALLMERVDRLGSAKEIVQTGAAIGREFTYELLRATVEVPDSELRNALDLFVASGLVLQEGEIPLATYHFKHALVQDAAYSTLPKKPRRILHARIANTLENRFAERVALEPELLANHYEQAGLTGPAVEYWHRAARRDAERSANVEALHHFNKALDVLKDLPQGSERNAMELELLLARGAPMLSVKGYASDDMGENYRRAKDLLQETSGSVHQFLAIKGLWVFHLVRGQIAKACSLAENLLSLATQEQISDLLIDAHHLSGSTYFFLGRFDEAKHHLLTAISLDDPNQHRSLALRYGQDPGITARILLVRTLWILGEVEQAEMLALEAIGMARELEHPYTLVFTLVFLSRIYSAVRNATRTLELTDEAIAVSTRYSFALGLAWATSSQGWALAENGQKEGLGKLLHGLSATRDTGGTLDNTFTLALLAEIYLRNNRIDEGLAAIEEALKLAVTGGELFWHAELLRLKGELLLGQPDESVQEAEECLCEALKIAQDQHATMLELRAATSLAKLWRKLNKVDNAKRILHSIYSRFNEHVDNLDLIEAKTVLEQLSV
ncbi:tetratricopeptide repeat protein [Nitrosomonas nitrosa]|uniref:SAM domain (Sterile alpha motif) n=1 Tax=Nitrosomonas nitrosa TaxID=52442 RepID=A0A8H8YYJ5_9PROT|nr:adenylate/guanylate cyclase domain-containing protein [Nitrosomonas nitrosa]PTQ92163.1 tetratricopeptide repeat protein [Nitrosomonas nitrosa]CAE6490881.1 SAM domain (Sterile alpha motif) [Nitrosomonas nitrosa]